MRECENRLIRYLFKLKMSSGAKNLIRDIELSNPNWANASQGWQGYKTTIQLQGWEQKKRPLFYVASTNRKNLPLPRQLKISNQHFFLNLFRMKKLLNGNTAFG